MEKVFKATKKGKREYRRGNLSGEEVKVMEFLINSKSATPSQVEVGGCEMWLVRSMRRKGLVREVEE